MSYVLAIPGLSIRGNGYARAGAKPEDIDAWVIVPFAYEPSLKHHGGRAWREQALVQQLDPKVVQHFETKAEAMAWKKARAEHQQRLGRPVARTAMVWSVGSKEAA